MADTCLSCRFYNRISGEGGQCRRYPPTLVWQKYDLDGDWGQDFPYMGRNEWCGEHRPASPEADTQSKEA